MLFFAARAPLSGHRHTIFCPDISDGGFTRAEHERPDGASAIAQNAFRAAACRGNTRAERISDTGTDGGAGKGTRPAGTTGHGRGIVR
ncbi:hypothetical protein SDC9_129947 [bioreactor metagenome]|uniref:Uncharacterized protein n=1 Tax=bioreactor metagenome TaxID=1076179 RepID=A0A645D189_9ZZZZ